MLLQEITRLEKENAKYHDVVRNYSENLAQIQEQATKWQKLAESQQSQVDSAYALQQKMVLEIEDEVRAKGKAVEDYLQLRREYDLKQQELNKHIIQINRLNTQIEALQEGEKEMITKIEKLSETKPTRLELVLENDRKAAQISKLVSEVQKYEIREKYFTEDEVKNRQFAE